MKKIFLATLIFNCLALSQEVGVKIDKVATTAEEGTTISITKGAKKESNKKKYIISEGTEEVTGDKDVVLKSAEKNWQKACKEWKTEFKENNKDNRIVSMSCGKMSCSKNGVESTCESIAKYKVRMVEEE
jgi:hypothetical protein